MKEIIPFVGRNAAHGLSLILPAYKSAFVSIGKVWALLAFGGVVAVTNDLFVGQSFDDGFPNLGVIARTMVGVLLIGTPTISFFIYLVISAKIWVVCFTAQNPEANRSRAFFGFQEKAAFGAFFKATLVSGLIMGVPLIAFAIAFAGLNFLTEGAVTTSEAMGEILFISVFILQQVVIARYFLAVPMSVEAASSTSAKSVSLDQAWQRTKDAYPTILMALIPIALVETGLKHVIGVIINDAVHDGVSLSYLRVATPLSYYVTTVMTGLATLHVILKVWSQTHMAEVDQEATTH